MSELVFSDSVFVDVEPGRLYALVSDVTRMGEWSPQCTGCEWDDAAAGAVVGAWFTGHNATPERTWQSRCQVVTADPGREFAWNANNGVAIWGFRLAPEAGGTRLTQFWEFGPAGRSTFDQRYGEDADRQIEDRSVAAHSGIPATLAAIKTTAEAG